MTHVRAARPEDYDDFVRLYREISLGEPAAEQRSWDGLHCRQARMAVEGDRVVGYLRYELFDDFAYVHHLSVAPEARRRGVGLKLMRHAAGEIRAHGIRRWMLHVLADNAAAQALYALLGLERAGRSTTLSVSFDALERASGDVSALSVGPLPAERDAALDEQATPILGGAEDEDVADRRRAHRQDRRDRFGQATRIDPTRDQDLVAGDERRLHRPARDRDQTEREGAEEEAEQHGHERDRERPARRRRQRGRWKVRDHRVSVAKPTTVFRISPAFCRQPRQVPSEVPPPNDQ